MGLTGLSRAGRQLRPVFIVGEVRSGTTLLYRLLQQQPAFGPAEPHLVESHFVTTLLTRPELDSAGSWPLRNYLMEDEQAWDRFVRAAGPLLAVRRSVLRSRPNALRRPTLATALGMGTLARSYLAVAADVRAAARLVEKTADQTPFAGHLLRWFPGARLLYIARHPIDTITSYWRRADIDPRAAAWGRVEIDGFAVTYATNTRLAQEWAALRPSQFLVLRYEDLVGDPSATMARVCQFAGERFEPTAIRSEDREPPKWDRHVWGDVVAQTKQWRDHIDEATARELETRLAPSLAALGYERYTA